MNKLYIFIKGADILLLFDLYRSFIEKKASKINLSYRFLKIIKKKTEMVFHLCFSLYFIPEAKAGKAEKALPVFYSSFPAVFSALFLFIHKR